jgi:hypothetical protein
MVMLSPSNGTALARAPSVDHGIMDPPKLTSLRLRHVKLTSPSWFLFYASMAVEDRQMRATPA